MKTTKKSILALTILLITVIVALLVAAVVFLFDHAKAAFGEDIAWVITIVTALLCIPRIRLISIDNPTIVCEEEDGNR